MELQTFDSVWDAIETTPERAENLKIRSTLMIALQEHIKKTGMTQTQAAAALGVTQPRISNLMRGKIELFGLEMLVNMAIASGMHIDLQIREAA